MEAIIVDFLLHGTGSTHSALDGWTVYTVPGRDPDQDYMFGDGNDESVGYVTIEHERSPPAKVQIFTGMRRRLGRKFGKYRRTGDTRVLGPVEEVFRRAYATALREYLQRRQGKKTTRYPRAPIAEARLTRWTLPGVHAGICESRYGGEKRTYMAKLGRHMDAYFEHRALRVPEVPHGAREAKNASSLVLWRGDSTFDEDRVFRPGQVWTRNCFASFSLDQEIASVFANPGPIFRLHVSRIARGTPWVWFTSEDLVEGSTWRRRGGSRQLKSMSRYEAEVLLPPGAYKVLNVLGEYHNRPVVDIAFAPLPRYVRRGVLPRFDPATGNALVSTRAGTLRIPKASPYVTQAAARLAALQQAAKRRAGVPVAPNAREVKARSRAARAGKK